MLQFLLRLAMVLLLGVLTSALSALALAAWMPIEIPLPHRSCYFVADQRPWSVAQRRSRGVHFNWWLDLDSSGTSPSPSPAQTAGDVLPAEPILPTTAQGLVDRVRSEHQEAFATSAEKPRLSPHPPTWGTFAGTPRAPLPAIGTDHGFGWPFIALWYRVDGERIESPAFGRVVRATQVRGGYLIRGAAEIRVRGYDHRALPFLPHYRGLLANSALYASLWALLIFAPPLVRLQRRLRRGHCPQCGYDLQGNLVQRCPECGCPGPN
jgi:hypothetical protein